VTRQKLPHTSRRCPQASLHAICLAVALLSSATRAQPLNDDCVNALPIAIGRYTGDMRSATRDGSASCSTSTQGDVWFRYTATSTGRVGTNTFGSNFSTVLSVHDPLIDGCPGGVSDELACSRAQSSPVGFNAVAGNQYLIRVAGDGAIGDYALNIGPVPINDDCANATPVSEGEYAGDATYATPDGLPSARPDIWFRYTASSSGPVSFDTLGAGPNALLAIHNPQINGCPGDASDLIVSTTSCGGSQQACATVAVTAGMQYLVRVAAIGPASLSIQPAGSISGRVTEEANGQPLEAVNVRLYNEFDPRYYNPPPIATVTTDALGNYLATGLRPGIYRAQAEVSGYVDEVFAELSGGGYAADPTAGTPITVSTATTTTGVDFTLSAGGKISGRVVDAVTGNGVIAGIYVQSTDGSGSNATASSDASGQYTTNIGQLGTGNYTVFAQTSDHSDELYFGLPCLSRTCDFSLGTPVAVTAGSTTSGIDFALVPATGVVRGVVTHNGLPDDRLLLRNTSLYDAIGNRVGLSRLFLCYPPQCGSTAVAFYFDGLIPGTYFVRTEVGSFDALDELYNNIPCPNLDCSPTLGTPIQVTGGTVNINIDLGDGGSIAGSVLAADTGLPANGFGPLYVAVYSASGIMIAEAQPNGDGSYVVPHIPSGSFHVRTRVYTPQSPYQDEVYNNIPCPQVDCNVLAGTPVPVVDGNTTPNINFTLDRADYAGGISGRVARSSNGVGLANVSVEIYDSANRLLDSLNTVQDGVFASQAHTLLAGDHYLRVRTLPYQPGYRDILYGGQDCAENVCVPNTGTPVVVGAGDWVSGINFELEELCPAPLDLLPASLPATTAAGVPYAAMLSTPNAHGIVEFAIGGGTMPPGLTLASNGEIGGAPSASGTFNFSITATDAAGCFGAHAYSLSVTCALDITPTNLDAAITNTSYAQLLSARGGVAPYAYSQTSGALPSGIALSSSGRLQGSASSNATGSFIFGVTADDSSGCTVTQSFQLQVLPNDVLFRSGFDP
jgi:hypothetical protein